MEGFNFLNGNDGKVNSSIVDGSGTDGDGSFCGGNGSSMTGNSSLECGYGTVEDVNGSGGNVHKDCNKSSDSQGNDVVDAGDGTGGDSKEDGGGGNGSDTEGGNDHAKNNGGHGKDKDSEHGDISAHSGLGYGDGNNAALGYSDHDSNDAHVHASIADDDMSDDFNDGDDDDHKNNEDDYNDRDNDDTYIGDDSDYNDSDDNDYNDGDDDDYENGGDDYNDMDDDYNDMDDDYNNGNDDDYNDSDDDDYNNGDDDGYIHREYDYCDDDDDFEPFPDDSDKSESSDDLGEDYRNDDNDMEFNDLDNNSNDEDDYDEDYNISDNNPDEDNSNDNDSNDDNDYDINTGDYNSNYGEDSKKKDDGVCNKKRKLRWCPQCHLSIANSLTNPNDEIIVIGKYRYSHEHKIGSGASSTTFVTIKDENVDSTSETIECRAYALKRMDKAKIDPKEIKREITTLLSLPGKCENIVKYHETIMDRYFQYLCLELMDGDLCKFVKSVDDNSCLIKDAAWPVNYCKQIINCIEFLHQQKFVHRDIKPGNILYTREPTLQFKIADFGLTKNVSSLCTMTLTKESNGNMVPGTRCWIAPELVTLLTTEHTRQSDIFSLGLVLHYLITMGKHPFAELDETHEVPPHVIEQNIANMKLNLDMSLHPEAANFLQQLLVKDPSERPLASNINRHPFLWTENKKIEFLKAVGDQPEAEKPNKHSNSELEGNLQATTTAKEFQETSWDRAVENLYKEMTSSWKRKKYRTDKVIDLVRFIRNAYAHNNDKSEDFQKDLEGNIFLRKYPSLVLDVFNVVQKLGFHETRNNIRQVLEH